MEDTRVVYSIVAAGGDVGWDVKRNDEPPLRFFRAKGEAFQFGRKLAEEEVKHGGRSALKVHSDAGEIEMEKCYD
jgi:hypothetical protein